MCMYCAVVVYSALGYNTYFYCVQTCHAVETLRRGYWRSMALKNCPAAPVAESRHLTKLPHGVENLHWVYLRGQL